MVPVVKSFVPGIRHLAKILCVIVCATLFLPVAQKAVPVPVFSALGFTVPAQAQERPKTLFDLLFKRKDAPNKNIQTVPKANKRSAAPRRATKKRAQPAARSTQRAAVTASAGSTPDVEKAENARKVLVIGDFTADGMSEGLVEAFEDVANVIVETRTNGSSGLVRDDFYDWPKEIPAIIAEVEPAIVVVMLGSNDRQIMRIGNKSVKVGLPEWEAEYVSRVNALIAAIRNTNTPVMWVGSPPFRFRSMSADILTFNEIYRQAVEAAGGYFVDIWDGFVDEAGNFITTGSDIKGQQVRLRANDGINFTSAGKRKMAFYVERQLKQLLGDAASPLLTSLATENVPLLTLPPLQTEADLQRTNPIAIDDPDFDGGSILLGDVLEIREPVVDNPLIAKSVRQRLVEDGVPPPAQPGRADNFSWDDEG